MNIKIIYNHNYTDFIHINYCIKHKTKLYCTYISKIYFKITKRLDIETIKLCGFEIKAMNEMFKEVNQK